MPNNRIFYAVHQVGIKPDGQAGAFTEMHGVQSVGITTNFNLEQVFELGQIKIYENVENIPDVEVTLEKVLDGYPLIYHLATEGSPSATLAGRSAQKSVFALSIFPDTNDASSGDPISEVEISGVFPSSISYTFPVDGNLSESVTLVGNNKLWNTGSPFTFTGAFDNTDEPLINVQRRQHVIFDLTGTATLTSVDGVMIVDDDTTILPPEVDGISASGANDKDAGGNFGAHIQNITCSTDLGREELFELGRKGPYFRFVNFPVEVTSEIETIGVRGDLVSATEEGIIAVSGCPVGRNLRDRRIRIRACEGTRIDLGDENKLSSVSYGGGDAGGGNVSLTYSYSTFNDMTVTHPQDPTVALRP